MDKEYKYSYTISFNL